MFFNDFHIYVALKLVLNWSRWVLLAFTLVPCWFSLVHVGSCWPKSVPSWPKLAEVGPSWLQVGAKLAPCWPHVAPSVIQVNPKLAPSWRILAQVGPSWPKFVPSWSKMARLGPCWHQDNPMMANLQGVVEACQGVHEGSASKAWIVAIVVVLPSL